MAIKALEQEPCKGVISIPKDALKWRGKNMVAYNVEWLREYWQKEMDIVCGIKPCEDAISRQAAIDNIMGEPTDAHYPSWYADKIAALPSVTPKQRWIPVSERLPKEYGEYLITWTTSQSKRPFIAICECEISNLYNFEKNRFDAVWLLDDYIKNYPDVEVIAWMPLPKSYESQESEEQTGKER